MAIVAAVGVGSRKAASLYVRVAAIRQVDAEVRVEEASAHDRPPAILRRRPSEGARLGAGGATVRRIGPARPKS